MFQNKCMMYKVPTRTLLQAEYNRHGYDTSQAMFQNKCMMHKVPTRTQLQTNKTVYNKITNIWAWLQSRFMQKCVSIMVYSTCEIKNKTFAQIQVCMYKTKVVHYNIHCLCRLVQKHNPRIFHHV